MKNQDIEEMWHTQSRKDKNNNRKLWATNDTKHTGYNKIRRKTSESRRKCTALKKDIKKISVIQKWIIRRARIEKLEMKHSDEKMNIKIK